MNVTDSDKRRNKILELVVEAYVLNVEPVGSEFISRKLRSMLSPATIRNVMSELEESGFLEQPHTSAGRVPTDRGYRYYVDAVMDRRRISSDEVRQMECLLQPLELDAERLMERASSVLSQSVRQAAFAVAPTVKRSTVKQIELVPLGMRKLLCVLIANEEMVASHVVEVKEPITRDETVALARFFNTELVGLSCRDLLESLERRMLSEHDSFYYLVKRSFDILRQALSTEPTERFFLDGASFIVSQPEFTRDPRKASELLRGLDAEDILLERIRQDGQRDGVQVRIGLEIGVPGLEACSCLTAPFSLGPDVLGRIGILGPKRMDYPRMRAFVEGMGRCLTEFLGRWEER